MLLIPSSDGVTHGDTFRQLDDFLYFTGLELPGSMLALDADEVGALIAEAALEGVVLDDALEDLVGVLVVLVADGLLVEAGGRDETAELLEPSELDEPSSLVAPEEPVEPHDPAENEVAAAPVDPDDGAITGLVGGFDFATTKFNRATQAFRQPGSSFKPFIYSAALESGNTMATIILDAPVVINSSELEQLWRPVNYSGRFYGEQRVREAMVGAPEMVGGTYDNLDTDLMRQRPGRLVAKAGAWYLVCARNGSVRTLRVSSVVEARVTDERRAGVAVRSRAVDRGVTRVGSEQRALLAARARLRPDGPTAVRRGIRARETERPYADAARDRGRDTGLPRRGSGRHGGRGRWITDRTCAGMPA